MVVVALPHILSERLTDEGAHAIVEVLDKVTEESERITLGLAEERFEKRVTQIDNKIESVRADLEAKIEKVRADLEAKIEKVRADLEAKIEKVRADLIERIEKGNANLIKWMFIFWVGQIGVLTAILLAFFKR